MAGNNAVKVTDRPELYDWEYGDFIEDIPMYQKMAGDSLEILECGIGTGRIAIPLARKGRLVYGIDNSRPMLDQLKQNLKKEEEAVRNRVYYFEEDMRNFELNRKFQFVYVPFSTFNYLLDVDSQLESLSSFRKHLQPEGTLVLELLSFSYQPFGLIQNKGMEQVKRARSTIDKNEIIEMTRRAEFDCVTQIVKEMRYFNYYDNDGKLLREEVVEWVNRFFFLGELECLLKLTGFKIVNIFGDFSLKKKIRHNSQFAIVKIKINHD